MPIEAKYRRSMHRCWNGGSRKTAMAEAKRRTEQAITFGCERCPFCRGLGIMLGDPKYLCESCSGSGFLVPECGIVN